MMKRLLLIVISAAVLGSCETSSNETSVPTDTLNAPEVEPGAEFRVDYFKNLPDAPRPETDVRTLLSSGKWVLADYKVKNLDKGVLAPGEDDRHVHDHDLFPTIKDFYFSASAEQYIDFHKARVASCTAAHYEINKLREHLMLTVICDSTRSEVSYTILGINESLLYLKEDKGLYPFDIYYVMKKE